MLLNKAKKLAGEDIEPTEAVKQLGLGWDGDEALAIAVYSVLKTPNDFQQVLVNACNHDGDSDTVGSIAGGIMGTYLGYDGIPNEFKEKVELENELKDLACDLLTNPKEIKQRKRRYPIQKKV
jgi:ADP-ribosylglycohydrolase